MSRSVSGGASGLDAGGGPRMRARAASMATSAASDAVPWMTPPPVPELRGLGDEADRGSDVTTRLGVSALWRGARATHLHLKVSGRPIRLASMSIATCSSSVAAGEPIHEKPMTLRAAESISPSMPGAEEFAGKYPKKDGDCQCVTPAG